MRNHFSKLAYAATLAFAITLTLSCSKDDDGGNPSGGSNDIGPCSGGTVTIDTQIWQKCNSDVVPSTGKSACYDNKPENCAKYGRLYDWDAAKTVCPSGWHLPSKGEWDVLSSFIQNDDKRCISCDAKHLKATSGWNEGGNGLDSYGFSALPGGDGSSVDYFFDVGNIGNWWGASEDNSSYAYIRVMSSSNEFADWNSYYSKDNLFSVRCLKDNGSSATGSSSSVGSSSSSSAPFTPSSESQSGEVLIEGFSIDNYGNEVVISGNAMATASNPIVKVTYSTNNPAWISYKGNPLSGNGSVTVDNAKYFDLSDAEIDLRNSSIPCGEFNISVEVRTSQGSVARINGTFTKPESFCVAVWKFGNPVTDLIYANTSVNMGGGSGFKLVGDPDINIDSDLEITGGKIRYAILCEADTPTPGVSYSSEERCLGSKQPQYSKLSQIEDSGIQQGDYYMVYLNGGSVYLLQFKKDGTTFASWPIKYSYWLATEHP